MNNIGWPHRIKHAIDLTGAMLGLVVLTPLMLVIAWRVWRDVGWPVLFRQTRPGLHDEPFELIKFRTMGEDRRPDGQLLPAGERLTSFGRMLRRSSLDELPELWNVLRGDMSIVGPRPLLMDYLDLYNEEQSRRHNVQPGITGWAQINGRNAITWEEKFSFDVWYCDNWSLWLDFKILGLTFLKVVKREGIQYGPDEVMPRFSGTRSVENTERSGA